MLRLSPFVLFVLALLFYACGWAAGSLAVAAVGALFELAFWARLFPRAGS